MALNFQMIKHQIRLELIQMITNQILVQHKKAICHLKFLQIIISL
jgi:hypothetical protein